MAPKTHPNALQEIAADYFQRKDEWFLSTLGALTAQWELVEFQLTLFLCAITGITRQHDLLQVLNSIGSAQKVRFLNSMIKFHLPHKDQQQEATAVVKKYDNLRKRRNKYVHALWMQDLDGINSSPQSFTAVSRLKKHAASRRHLRQLCEELQDLIGDINTYYSSSGNLLQIDAI